MSLCGSSINQNVISLMFSKSLVDSFQLQNWLNELWCPLMPTHYPPPPPARLKSQSAHVICIKFVMKPNLTHWGRHEMNNISQTTFSNVFSSMNMLEFRLKFHWSLFPRAQLIIFQHWFRQWLGAVQATSHYLKQWWLVYRRINALLDLNVLRQQRAHDT